MCKKTAVILWLISFFPVDGSAKAPAPSDAIKTDVVSIRLEQQYDVVQPGGKSALAIHFELKEDWHFYASPDTAPARMNLKLTPSSADYISFSEPIFPRPQWYFDKTVGKTLEVFSNRFTVFLPFSVSDVSLEPDQSAPVDVKVLVKGAVCSGFQCRMPEFDNLNTKIQIAKDATMGEPKFTLPARTETGKTSEVTVFGQEISSAWGALLLALLAGLSLNIMPCVWPVLPLIVMRIVEQAKQDKTKSTALGLAFCLGILLFFACLAGANIVLQLFYGTVLQWGDQFRNPGFVAGMVLLLVVLALFMFGVFTITVPSSVAGKAGTGKGYVGSIGMGFLAAVLSTPCSFAVLAAAFAWAQAQPLFIATLAIMVIGLGMALPYAILTSIPGLLKKLPKAGRWMELFKQAIGFVLLFIAVKLIAALPQTRRMDILYFTVVLGFCVWMWGTWVTYGTKPLRKWLIRIIAVILAVAAGRLFLQAPPAELINWQKYDASLIENTLKEKQPLLIKFTADWCLSCQAVEKVVYSRKDIAELIEQKNVLMIKADTTEKDFPATVALKNIYNEPGVPVSMLFTPGGEDLHKWRGIFFADELKTLLEKLPSQ